MNIPEKMHLVTVKTGGQLVHVPMLLNEQEAHKFQDFANLVTRTMQDGGTDLTISIHERREAPVAPEWTDEP